MMAALNQQRRHAMTEIVSSSSIPHPMHFGEPHDIVLRKLREAKPVFWAAARGSAERQVNPPHGVKASDVDATVARWQRFRPLLALLFPELVPTNGVIESELVSAPALQRSLQLPAIHGTVLVKCDHALPIAGSIKARGGIHEVLEYAEALARIHNLLPLGSDYRVLAQSPARALFADHQIAVGSTGNLGLAIGAIASALGFRTVVHMSADAKAWKKSRLRARGIDVIEHAGDYAQAVAVGRTASLQDHRCHFVDDEHSRSLFLGYAAAATRLAHQLAELGRRVNARHPLFVYLPCGVGGAPGGIAFGLKQIFGQHVHCFFAEPTRSPCFLLRMLAGAPGFAMLGDKPSVYTIGLDNRTEADGLAVPSASELAVEVSGPLLSGGFTVEDRTLFQHLQLALESERMRLEPSAAAGFSGPHLLVATEAGKAYVERCDLREHMSGSTHVLWTTGGLLVPDEEYGRFLDRARS